MMQSFGIPQGMRDILAEESRARTIMKDRLKKYLLSCGFCRIETSLFEYYDLFSGGSSPIDDESIIKTIDRDGKIVVLRPDMTVPAARVAATKLKEQPKPLKLCYTGNVYRSDKKNRGTAREICQVGAEIFGSETEWTDLEILSMVQGCFREASVDSYKIDIGHMGIVKGIFKDLAIPEEKKAAVIALVRGKNLVELEKEVSCLEIDSRHKELICRLPSFFGAPEDIFKRIDSIIINSTVQKAAEYLLRVWEKCREMGLRSNLLIDIGMTGEVNYYTSLIFRAYAKGAGSSVISGGRYDNLLRELGLDCPAAGFAVDVDNMIKAAGQGDIWKPKEHRVLVIYSGSSFLEAMEYSEGCRTAGSTANLMNYSDVSKPEQYKEQYGYDEIVYFR